MNTGCSDLEHWTFTRWLTVTASLPRIGVALLAVLVGCSHAEAAFRLVAHVTTESLNSGDVATSAPIDTTSADLCVASVSEYTGGSGFATPTDSQSATAWTGLTPRTQGAFRIRLFYKVITPGTSHTFGSTGASGSYPSMAVACFSGVDMVTPFDLESAGGGANGTSVQPGSVTPRSNDALVISAVNFSLFQPASPAATVSPGTIAAQLQGTVLSYQVQTTASATNPTFSLPLSGPAVAAAAAFKSASAVSDPVTTPPVTDPVTDPVTGPVTGPPVTGPPSASPNLIQTSNIRCAGTFRIALPPGSSTDFSHGITAMTYRFDPSDQTRHYFALGGDGHVIESVEPALSPCDAPHDQTNFATAATWGTGGPDGSAYGSDWGAYPLTSTSGCPPGAPLDFLPGECGQIKPAGLKWDSANNYLLETWYPTYGAVTSFGKNSIAAVTMNNDTHTLSLVGCWAANPSQWMQQVGGGVITPPASWVAANSGLLPPGPRGYWLLGLGGPTGTVQLVSNGPSLQLVPVPSQGNACTNGTITAYPTARGVTLANFQANPNGPSCGYSTIGCNTAGSPPTHPYAAQTAFTGYSSTLSPFWWDPYGGHGWFWGGTSLAMDWYDDGVVQGVLVPFGDVSGWATGRVASSPAPTYDPATQIGSFSTTDPIDTHDGYTPHAGDALWVQTCVAGVDPDCGADNARDWTFVTINSVSNTAPYTVTYKAWGLDYGSGSHLPVPGLQWWFGPFYGHGAIAGTFPRAMFRLQVIDPQEYTKVLNGTYPTPDLPTYHEDIDASALLPRWGGPATGAGVAQNFNGANSTTGPSWAAADADRQQFLVNVSFTECTNGPAFNFCAQIYVWNIGH